jgi:hypothetical protein
VWEDEVKQVDVFFRLAFAAGSARRRRGELCSFLERFFYTSAKIHCGVFGSDTTDARQEQVPIMKPGTLFAGQVRIDPLGALSKQPDPSRVNQ